MSGEPVGRCSKELRHGGWHDHHCTRKGIVREEGELWCRQHAPSAVRKRRAEQSKRINAHVRRMHRDMEIKDRQKDLILAVKEVDGLVELPEGITYALKKLKEAESE